MTHTSVPPTALFRFAVPCRFWNPGGDGLKELPETHVLPHLAALNGAKSFAELRLGWHESGVTVSLRVARKTRPVQALELRPIESDGISLFIATRDTRDVHRANKFCHRFFFAPTGGGPRRDQPFGRMMAIERAKEIPTVPPEGVLSIRSKLAPNGYIMHLFMPAKALTGYAPAEYASLGFGYLVNDCEHGEQVFTCGLFPYLTDPSCWANLDLLPTTDGKKIT